MNESCDHNFPRSKKAADHLSENTTVSISGTATNVTISHNSTTTSIPITSTTTVSTSGAPIHIGNTTLHPATSKTTMSTSGPATTKPGNVTSTIPHIGNTTSIPVTTISVPIISHFHAGSFIGGIVLAFALVGIFYFGRKFCISRSGTRYRTIEETEAII
ncbi:porimin isoform X2 [Callorhinchus milii]|uniref:porimin isoform X2 n=1 Tax=Callorhinchus milii TaxID=7868 RepID=UPI001C3FC277|nr:porimin isoform X2 [Callorhinchus milii]